jgi:mono/diheme cytochrome c family protein
MRTASVHPFILATTLVLAAGAALAAWRVRHDAARVYDEPAPALAVGYGPAAVARGEHLVRAVSACTTCHGADLGGAVMMSHAFVGRVVAPSLAGPTALAHFAIAARRTDGSDDSARATALVARAIRRGVGPDGRSLRLMPSRDYAGMSDADVGAIIAYLRSLPAVDRHEAGTRIGPAMAAAYAVGRAPLFSAAEVRRHPLVVARAVAPDSAVAAGRYLAGIGGCAGCHGANLSGGAIPGAPPGWKHARNITPDSAGGIGRWSEGDFVHALRTGRRPDGTAIDTLMPWPAVGRMTDGELHALWVYLRSIPPVPAKP